MKRLKTKSYNWVYLAIQKLHKEKIILFEEIGKATLCSINLDSELALDYLALLEQEEVNKRSLPNKEKIRKLVPTNYHTLLVAGSYALKKQKLF
ncbi:MAG: hypothetical protein QW331_04455 [Candidatus Woesearchaeota archaeon]